jgi:catechol 2,3-dioxygenase-like lactoylglutathione lyase family enzyme
MARALDAGPCEAEDRLSEGSTRRRREMRLADAKVEPALAVTDMGRAREFYEGKLGLSGGTDEPDGGHTYPCGSRSGLHIFPSPNAGGSETTVAGWAVDDVEATVEELTGSGVSFEQYDEDPLKTDERGIARLPDGSAAWFKDPDGNLMGIFQQR